MPCISLRQRAGIPLHAEVFDRIDVFRWPTANGVVRTARERKGETSEAAHAAVRLHAPFVKGSGVMGTDGSCLAANANCHVGKSQSGSFLFSPKLELLGFQQYEACTTREGVPSRAVGTSGRAPPSLKK